MSWHTSLPEHNIDLYGFLTVKHRFRKIVKKFQHHLIVKDWIIETALTVTGFSQRQVFISPGLHSKYMSNRQR
jgi:hypothetical protein